MKLYLVIATPHGDFGDVRGIFSTREKAEKTIDKWCEEDEWYQREDAAWEPYIIELILDEVLEGYK